MDDKKNQQEQLDVDTAALEKMNLKKHLWPDEIKAIEDKKKAKRRKVYVVCGLVLCIFLGWCGGSIVPLGLFDSLRIRVSSGLGLSSQDKIASVLNVMENDWYFGNQIDDIDTRLEDQAITGITTNSEDKHTEYMSEEEMTSFTQSINRNYVGIGVSYVVNGDMFMVEEVFKNSPAEKAGVQSGDIFYAVDGTKVAGKTSDELKKLIQGDDGTTVTITFLREGKYISLELTRTAVTATAYGYALDDNTVYLRINQFGDGTHDEVLSYLNDYANHDVNLVLDLRNNGGGYLTSVSKIASLFLPKDTVVMKQEYRDGTIVETKTTGGTLDHIKKICILVNGNTASAAEVLTLALKEQRENTTIVGTTTYGKGTVQVSRQFEDGSALKYTTSRWLSPSGTWVNEVGITPDVEVKLHDVMYRSFVGMEEGKSYQIDQVGEAIKDIQLALDYLGYPIDRTDGYFSSQTQASILQFQKDYEMEETGNLDQTTYTAIIGAVSFNWSTTTEHDTQLQKGQEILNG